MDGFFFVASKIAWLFVSPASLLLLLLIAGLLCLHLEHTRTAKWLLGVPVALFTLIACLPVDEWLIGPLESRFDANPPLPERVDGIIMLGGSLMTRESRAWEQVELSGAADRNFAFLALARRHPEARLLFTGGSGLLLDQEVKEAEIMADFLDQLGMPPERVTLEDASRNTWENALRSKPLAAPAAGENWILITSAYHMPRAVGAFCAQDWPVIPWPVDHQTSPDRGARVEFDLSGNLGLFTTAFREWLGLAAYFATGRIASPLPGGCAAHGDAAQLP